jgi:tRNA threonylcarbamoyladenosine biosynthesis protein TsaE
MSRRTIYSLSEEETYELGIALAGNLQGGELLLLEGDLGLGKTVLARGIAASLGVMPEDVNSPSFTLVQEYTGGRLPMFHVDLYRIDDAESIETLGIEDLLDGGSVVVVEWGEKLPLHLRRGATVIRFHESGEGTRQIEVLTGDEAPPPPSDA